MTEPRTIYSGGTHSQAGNRGLDPSLRAVLTEALLPFFDCGGMVPRSDDRERAERFADLLLPALTRWHEAAVAERQADIDGLREERSANLSRIAQLGDAWTVTEQARQRAETTLAALQAEHARLTAAVEAEAVRLLTRREQKPFCLHINQENRTDGLYCVSCGAKVSQYDFDPR